MLGRVLITEGAGEVAVVIDGIETCVAVLDFADIGEVAIVIEEAVLDGAEVIACYRAGVVDSLEIGVLAVGVVGIADRVDERAVGVADKALDEPKIVLVDGIISH